MPTPTQECIARAMIDPVFRQDLFNHHGSPEDIAAKYGVPKEGVQALYLYVGKDKELVSHIDALAEHVDKVVRIKIPGV